MSAGVSLTSLLAQLERGGAIERGSTRAVARMVRRCSTPGCDRPPAQIRQHERSYYAGVCAECADIGRRIAISAVVETALARIPAHHRVFALQDAALEEHVRPRSAVARARRLGETRPAMILVRGKQTGVGKTTLGTAFLLSLLRRAREPDATIDVVRRASRIAWWSAIDLGLASRESRLGATPPAIASAVGASVLLIDELGREADVEALWRVLYDRHKAELPTIVTTALDSAELKARFDDGGYRRLFEPPHAEVIELGLVNRRNQHGNERQAGRSRRALH